MINTRLRFSNILLFKFSAIFMQSIYDGLQQDFFGISGILWTLSNVDSVQCIFFQNTRKLLNKTETIAFL